MPILKIDVGLRQKQLNLLHDHLTTLTRELHDLTLAVQSSNIVFAAAPRPRKPKAEPPPESGL